MKFFQRTGRAVMILAVWSILLGSQSTCLLAQGAKTIVVEAQAIKNDTKPFRIELWTEDGASRYRRGDNVVFFFKAHRDCCVTLIDIGTSGKVTKLFPNKWYQSNKAEKGKTYRIPPKDSSFTFKVLGPGGNEYVKAIATSKPLECVDRAMVEAKGEFLQFKEPTVLLKNIGVELAKQRKDTWAETAISFEIVTREASASEGKPSE